MLNFIYMQFFKRVLKDIKPGGKVLDLGAGEGKQAMQFSKLGFDVTAVDKKATKTIQYGIKWHQSNVEDFLSTVSDKYDLIFAKNLLQFLDKGYVRTDFVETIEKIMGDQGIVAIQTFYKSPEPDFDKSCSSYYSSHNLQDIFLDFDVLYINQWDGVRSDLRGIKRHFYVSEIIFSLRC